MDRMLKLFPYGHLEREDLLAFAPAEAESESLAQAEWLAIYARHLDNVRAGLDWAFSSDGDPQIGAALTVAVVPLWVQLSMLGECRERVKRALAVLDGDNAATVRQRMQLSAALGQSLTYGVGHTREAGHVWTTTLELADRLGDTSYRLRALWGLCMDQFNSGDLNAALDFARRFAGFAEQTSEVIDLMMADRLLATVTTVVTRHHGQLQDLTHTTHQPPLHQGRLQARELVADLDPSGLARKRLATSVFRGFLGSITRGRGHGRDDFPLPPDQTTIQRCSAGIR